MSVFLNKLRNEGWMVAVHNDFYLVGRFHTFWLFTHPDGFWAKGEGRTDEEALRLAHEQAQMRISEWNTVNAALDAAAEAQKK